MHRHEGCGCAQSSLLRNQFRHWYARDRHGLSMAVAPAATPSLCRTRRYTVSLSHPPPHRLLVALAVKPPPVLRLWRLPHCLSLAASRLTRRLAAPPPRRAVSPAPEPIATLAHPSRARPPGDLVDNHDIVQFVVRPLDGVTDPDADHDAWANEEAAQAKHKLEEFDLRPPEALQRDYQRVLRAQAEAIKSLTGDVETLKQQLEFQLASLSTGITTTKKSLDDKASGMQQAGESAKVTEELASSVEKHKKEMCVTRRARRRWTRPPRALVTSMRYLHTTTHPVPTTHPCNRRSEMRNEIVRNAGGGGWKFPFFILLMLIVGVAGVGYNRYTKLYGKSHLP